MGQVFCKMGTPGEPWYPDPADQRIVFQRRRRRRPQIDILMDSVFRNPLLLTKILDNLALKDLKNARLVNHFWLDAARTPFLNKTQVNLNAQLRTVSKLGAYHQTMSPTYGHKNYSLLICDINARYTPSIPLFKKICSKFGINITNLKIDVDTHTMTPMLAALDSLERIPVQKLWIRIFLQRIRPSNVEAVERRQRETAAAAGHMIRIFSSVKFIYFMNYGYTSFQNEFLTQGILSQQLQKLEGGRFTELDQSPHSYTSLQILTLAPRNLTRVDFGELYPGCGPSFEKFLKRFANSLEEFKGVLGSCGEKEAFIVSVPVMRRLKNLHLAHLPERYRFFNKVKDITLSLQFGFYPNFVAQLPALKTLELAADATVEKGAMDLFHCFFPEGEVKHVKCTTVMTLRAIRNYYAEPPPLRVPKVEVEEETAGFYEKMKEIFPNAEIGLWNEEWH